MLSDYIKNPIRVARIEAGLNQEQLAQLMGVTQGYVSRIESRNYSVSDSLIKKAKTAIAQKGNRSKIRDSRRQAR